LLLLQQRGSSRSAAPALAGPALDLDAELKMQSVLAS
jgi:hypothetical protein